MPEYCVTGGTGFIASYLVKELLCRGYRVRATVRDPGDEDKVGFLWSMDGAKERLRLMKADLLVEGSFDEALDGVDGVFHTASPVFTSGNIQLWYAYAKTLAEKEAWKLAEEYGTNLVVVNPSFVVGPLLAPHPTSTLQMILTIMKGEYALYPNTTIGFVHIDDVVSAHMLAMEDSRASGRLICSSSVAHWSEIIQMLKAKYPYYPIPSKCDEKQGDNNPHSLNTSKAEELGLKSFRSITEMFDDCIQSLQKKGLL